MGYQRLSGGRFALTTHVGSYTSLPAAYRVLFERIMAREDVRPGGVPVIEKYHENEIKADFALAHTDIYIPVIPRSRAWTRPEAP